ncbi:hypothetical protein [Stenotrophomonas maltophilia]|uniref:hypothetical protein n=1 Tax=Stenotrophomonas maltophilia TaxID=40324 RepID=UPI0011B660EA|nr:hypothetical protein [Stenotrophomonas maltophilia]
MLKRTNHPRALGELDKIRDAVEALSGDEDLCAQRAKGTSGATKLKQTRSLTSAGCGAIGESNAMSGQRRPKLVAKFNLI